MKLKQPMYVRCFTNNSGDPTYFMSHNGEDNEHAFCVLEFAIESPEFEITDAELNEFEILGLEKVLQNKRAEAQVEQKEIEDRIANLRCLPVPGESDV